MLNVLLFLGLAAVGTGVTWVGSTWLERASERIGVHYGLPPVVQGAIVAAVGSSFPELSSVLLSVLVHGEFELGVAAIVGSAVFNILIIPAAAGLSGDIGLTADRDLVYKEAQFYMLSVATLFLAFAFAVIYYPTETGTALRGTMTPLLALIPLALYGLYIFNQYQDTNDYDASHHERSTNIGRRWLELIAGLAVILVGVEMLVVSAIELGDALGTPSFVWGLTVIAAGTSLPDTVVSVQAARGGRDSTSLANVFGSNIFDLLVAVPLGVVVGGAVEINFSRAAPMMAFLVFATVVLFTLMRTDMNVSGREAWLLLGLYALFVVWLVLEELGVTTLVKGG
ncbi:sodium:calcium antiporter [Haloarchaeobius salinus]|uniref:sodium:calcium antiporter n=1 Tax=Haloarchaeobius salinus TaxID=1198298 RepID=UPI00210942C7|nr:sodium:calcium antiporter [Haloarchaeobius salinus]